MRGGQPIKVLHVVPTYLPATRYGGPIHSVHGLCKALVQRGHEVEVFTTGIDGKGDSPVTYFKPVDVDGVRVTYHPGCWPRRLFAARGLAKSLSTRITDFGLVHVHSMFLLPTLLACSAALRSSVPYVLSPRGMLDPDLIESRSRLLKRAWIALFDRRNVEAAAAIHVTSEVEKAALLALGLSLPRLELIPNGIDLAELDESVRCERSMGKSPYALYLGRLSWKKGLERLISSWVDVPDLNLVVAGNDDEGMLPALRRQVSSLGLDSRVEFRGYVQGGEKWQLLRGAALFVLPSVSENFGIAGLEAMAAGVPVVVSPGVGLAETIVREDCGLVTDTAPEIMGPAIAALVRNAPERERMGQTAAHIARTQFDWSRIAARMEDAYAEITRKHAHRCALGQA